MWRSCFTTIGILICALLVLSSAAFGQPGEIITIETTCTYIPSPGQPPVTVTTLTYVVIRSPIPLSRPVYLCQGWFKTSAGGGTVNKLAAGVPVTTFVRMDGQVKLASGIQLLDGRVWIDEHPYDRADAPG